MAGWCCSLPTAEAFLPAWVPAVYVPPWILMGIFIQYAANVQSIKRAGVLVGQLMMGQSEKARCAVCDELVTRTFEVPLLRANPPHHPSNPPSHPRPIPPVS